MQSSTQYSPFHMMFGREPTFPIDTEHQLPLDEADQCEKLTNEEISVAMDSLHSFQKEMYSTAKENITKAQKKQKDYYDSRHQTQTFAVGEKVLVENTAQKQRKGGKLKDKWLGPYRINREICKGVYALESMDGKLMKQSCNVSRLKLYSEDVCLKNESSCRPKELTVHEDVTASDHTSINPSEDKPQHSSDELSQSHVSKDSVAKHTFHV